MSNTESFAPPFGDRILRVELRVQSGEGYYNYSVPVMPAAADGAFLWASPKGLKITYGDARELACEILLGGKK